MTAARFAAGCCAACSLVVLLAGAAPAPGGDGAASSGREAARALQSPLAYSDESIREGRKHYLRLCQNCHGRDGRALESFDYEATDLTAPERYRHGATDGDLYFSIREGAGNDMPAFKDKLTDEQVWQVVWFVRSLGPESARPSGSGAAAPGSDAAASASSSPAASGSPVPGTGAAESSAATSDPPASSSP